MRVDDVAQGSTAVCRDCAAAVPRADRRCAVCGSRRVFRHRELHTLTLGHSDCDAFYAMVEKRDRPELASHPVIVGGHGRGVVAVCCYRARLSGVRSAMPVAQALERCPDAVVIPPDMARYWQVADQARAMMAAFTPLLEPIALDAAYLDLSAVEAVLGISPAQALVKIVHRVERDLGITASIGLSYNKLLAKIASDFDKPKGFTVIGREDAVSFLSSKRVGILWGVGPALERWLAEDGLQTVGDLGRCSEIDLVRRYGAVGRQLYRFARGQDDRPVEVAAPSKSISAEDTLEWPVAELGALRQTLRLLAETVEHRMARDGVLARTVVLKLKTADFQVLTRRISRC